jgi:phage gpG-like protein
MARLEARIEGLEQLQKKLQPGLYEKALQQILEDAATLGERVAKGQAPRDTGALKRSIHSTVKPTFATVFSNLNYAVWVEHGRKPGKRPPVDALRGWARRHGWNPYALAFVIGKFGTKKRRGKRGRFFMKAATEKVRAKLPHFVEVASETVAKRWSK